MLRYNFIKIMLLVIFSTSLLIRFAGAYQVEYRMDVKGAHSSIHFTVSHLGIGWVRGRFNDFEGRYFFDEQKPENSRVEVVIKTESIDSGHQVRDMHLRGKRFFDVDQYPKAIFSSTAINNISSDKKTAQVIGDFTLHGVTKSVILMCKFAGSGDDPWGGYRTAFFCKTILKLSDYGIITNLGKASEKVEIELAIEGIRQ